MTEPNAPVVAWRLVLAAVAVVLVLVTIAVQLTQEEVIPPLIVFGVLLVAALVALVPRPRLGAIAIGVVAVLMVVTSVPFIAPDLSHPESFWSFVPATLAVLGAVVGLVGLVAVLRRAGPGSAGIAGAVGIAAVVGLVAVAAVSSGGQDDDVKQDGDQGMFAQDFEFVPDEFEAPGPTFGIFIGNDDLVRHNFSVDELGISEELPSKAYVRVAVEDAAPGTYEYYCDVEGHDDMKGTFTVP